MNEPRLDDAVPRAAAWLGGAGIIPFAAGAAGLWVLPAGEAAAVVAPLLGYGAVILSFMGAVHWGLAIASVGTADEHLATRWFALGVVPALVGWATLLAPPLAGALALAVAFAGVYLMDRAAAAAGIAPPWYLRLRAPLTVTVVSLLLVSASSIGTRLA